jgi:UDP-2,4-diacetamido-2,4,6-trideoxy-beta-L-altropyranose hydrolase
LSRWLQAIELTLVLNVAFRADASYLIGSGHIARCLALADALSEQGAQCSFVCRHIPDPLAARIRSRAYELIMLPASSFESADIDAQQTKEALGGRRLSWLIVDHYALDLGWERQLREFTQSIMVIDDLADRPHDCDVLLDQNYYVDSETRYAGFIGGDSTTCLLGPAFALLRPQFAALRAHLNLPQSERIFVSMGANDPTGICVKTIEALRELAIPELGADIVAGTDTAAHNDALEVAEGLPSIRVHGFIDDVAGVMARCTLAIGAGGSTTWERCAMGLPSIVIIGAENQRRMAIDLARAGMIELLGEAHDVSVHALAGVVSELIADAQRRSKMRTDCMHLVDGRGAYRVSKLLVERS